MQIIRSCKKNASSLTSIPLPQIYLKEFISGMFTTQDTELETPQRSSSRGWLGGLLSLCWVRWVSERSRRDRERVS